MEERFDAHTARVGWDRNETKLQGTCQGKQFTNVGDSTTRASPGDVRALITEASADCAPGAISVSNSVRLPPICLLNHARIRHALRGHALPSTLATECSLHFLAEIGERLKVGGKVRAQQGSDLRSAPRTSLRTHRPCQTAPQAPSAANRCRPEPRRITPGR